MHWLDYRQPDSDQILEYGCLEGEQDRQHYTEEYGGHAGVAVNNGVLLKTPENIDKTAAAPIANETIVKGCLRLAPGGGNNAYLLDTDTGAVPVLVSSDIADIVETLLDRTVRFRGTWDGTGKNRRLRGTAVRVLVEGCTTSK
jgi:hypothetical protein